MEQPSLPDPRQTTPLKRFTSLLGEDVFFVPCGWGTKKPLVSYADRPFKETKNPAYLAWFETPDVNIAVYLGRASGGLCAIDVDRDEDLAAFLALNPELVKTTRVRGSRGAKLLVRITGEFPRSCKANQFEWRADRNLAIVYGRHPEGMDYQLVVDTPPVVMTFDGIVWPAGWDKPWNVDTEDELDKQYGPPFYTGPDGALTAINEPYWAGLHAMESILVYEPDEKAFYRYREEKGIYEIESSDAIRSKITKRMLDASREANVFELQKKRTATTLNNIITHLRGTVEQRGAFAERRPIIHVANGVIVFTNGEAELRPFSPEYRSRNRSPIAFDENAECPRFLAELVRPAVDPDDVELLQKCAGMFLLGYNPAQRILILDGEAGRGKTQFANVMEGLVGLPNVTQLRTKFLADRFEQFRFLKRTLLVGVDVEPDFLRTKGAAALKGLVGGDLLDPEQKGGTGSFQTPGVFNVMITANARLRVRLQGDIGAWRRRLLIVRFEGPAPNIKIPDFGRYLLKTEGSGILNWGLVGTQKVLDDLAKIGDIVVTDRQADLVRSLLAESDSLRYFLRERLVLDPARDLTGQEIIEAYAAYCPERGWQPLPITEVQSQLEALMLELFCAAKRHDLQRNNKDRRGFGGVRLR